MPDGDLNTHAVHAFLGEGKTNVQMGSLSRSVCWLPNDAYLNRSMMASTRLCETSHEEQYLVRNRMQVLNLRTLNCARLPHKTHAIRAVCFKQYHSFMQSWLMDVGG